MGVLRPSGIAILVTYIIFNVFSIIAVVLRFVSLRIRHKSVKSHDWLALLSLVSLDRDSHDLPTTSDS